MRILAEPLTSGPLQGESVADYFIRKAGREAYANMLGPLYGGLYASDPAEMEVDLSLAHTLREAGIGRSMLMRALKRKGGAPPAACSFTGGMQMLPEALADLHRSTVMLGCAVHSIERQDASDVRFILTHTNGVVKAHQVVVTGNAMDTARLLRRIAPDVADSVATLRYNPLAIVHLHTSDAVPRALGYQISFEEDLATRGVTFNDAMFAREGIYTSYLGGAKRRRIFEWPDDRIASAAIDEFRLVTGASARAVSVARAVMPAWDWSWRALDRVHAPDGIHFCTNWESRPGLPGRLTRARALAQKLASGLGVAEVRRPA
jgi:oxygen-dependent protoporphyrinogen oxidase